MMPSQRGNKHLDLTCLCGASAFGLHVLKDEGLACAKCMRCNRDYLLWDTKDYWFDVIQSGYPRPTRCSCKGVSFTLCSDYLFRDDGDVRSIDLRGTCTTFGKEKRLMNADIDYSGTESLFTQPLSYCKNPKILYDLKDLSLYVTRSDMAAVVRHIYSAPGWSAITWLRERGEWVKRTLNEAETAGVILAGDSLSYIRIYLLPRALDVPDSAIDTSRKEDSFWKKHELVRISSPTHMGLGDNHGLLYYIQFANEYISDDRVIHRSAEFQHATGRLLDWLRTTFVSWRGPQCFDNPSENIRLFGDRFAKGKQREYGR
jgi:hypothetical protein